MSCDTYGQTCIYRKNMLAELSREAMTDNRQTDNKTYRRRGGQAERQTLERMQRQENCDHRVDG